MQAIEPLFSMQAAFHTNDGSFVNNEFIDVYLITINDEIPVQTFVLQQEEVAAVRSECQHSYCTVQFWEKLRYLDVRCQHVQHNLHDRDILRSILQLQQRELC